MREKILFHDRLVGAIFNPIIPGWVTPNHVTIFRLAATPAVLWLLTQKNYVVGVPVFLFVAFTDVLDGSLARLRSQVTDWGRRADPFVDKVLIGSVLLVVVLQHVDPYLAAGLVTLDVIAIIIGAIRVYRGEKVAANRLGKIKMFLQCFGIMSLLLAFTFDADIFIALSNGSLWLALIFAVLSLLSYGL